MTSLVHDLSANERDRLSRHFRQLDPEDQRLRFGIYMRPEALDDYVQGIDFSRDPVFGIYNDGFELTAVAHLGLAGETAELGLSVLPGYRRQGLGTLLLKRVVHRACALGYGTLWTHCLRENEAMIGVARKADMRIVLAGGEADAYLALPPSTPLAYGLDVYESQMSLLMWAMRRNANGAPYRAS